MGFYFGADNRIRTGDLVLTKDVLYRLSHISVWIFCITHYIEKGGECQADFYIEREEKGGKGENRKRSDIFFSYIWKKEK